MIQQCFETPTDLRMLPCRSDLGGGFQYEATKCQAGVWNNQIGLCNNLLIIEQQIKVDCASTPPLVADAAQLLLDGHQLVK